MIAVGLVLAQAKAPPPGLQPPSLWATLVVAAVFVAVLALGVIVISLLGRWRKQVPPTDFDPNEQLAQFQQLYEKGELSQEEFDKIRERMRRQICLERTSRGSPRRRPQGRASSQGWNARCTAAGHSQPAGVQQPGRSERTPWVRNLAEKRDRPFQIRAHESRIMSYGPKLLACSFGQP